MKICIFTETYYPVVGGGEIQAQLLAKGLIANGHSVIILTRRSDTALKKQERCDDVNVYRLAPVGGGQLKKWGLLLSGLPMLISLRHQYDLIFVSGYRIIGLAAILAGKLLRKPVILKADSQGEMSGDFFESGLKRLGGSRTSLLFRLFLKVRNAILKKADAFSAISSEIASEWKMIGIPAKRIHLIPNGVDTTRFVPIVPAKKNLLRKKLNLPQKATIAIYTGRLVSYKGLPLLLKVWKQVSSRHRNVLLLLVGTGGLDIHNCEAQMHEFVNTSGLGKRVRFTSTVENVSEYLQASDIFVFPTENEAFGNSLVEAMACGLPVVTTPVGAIKTIVLDKENGLLVRVGNFNDLYEALDLLMMNKVLAECLGRAARQSVQVEYAVHFMTKRYISLFQAVTDST